MKISYKTLQRKYSGMYVLSDEPRGKVIASARKLSDALKKAGKKGHQNPAIEFIEPSGMLVIYDFKVSLRK